MVGVLKFPVSRRTHDSSPKVSTPVIGVYTYSYVVRATTPGLFIVPPAKAEEMYHPETFGRRAVVVRRRTQLKAVPYFQPTPPSPLLLPAQQRRKDVQQIVGFAIRPLTAKKRQE
jgi:Bacterial Alpha-2-macroglobulin MG10 domain